MDYENYLMHDVPLMLNQLGENQVPEWGSMTAGQMLAHLTKAIQESTKDEFREIETPKDKLELYKKWLKSDKPLAKGAKAPKLFLNFKAEGKDFKTLKVELMQAIVEMQLEFKKNPEFSSIHPSFGRLNRDEWLHLHCKHIHHHMVQFNLVN